MSNVHPLYVGGSQPRVEGRLKVTGQARYVAEHAADLYPNLRHAVIVAATGFRRVADWLEVERMFLG